MIVGVLAVQGDFAEHIAILDKLNVRTREVRLPQHLDGLDALIIPGGESTTLRKLCDLYGLSNPIVGLTSKGMPVWGTCAGMIMMARELTDEKPDPLELVDIVVTRNGYGRQVESFEINLAFPVLGGEPFRAIFIRAPMVTTVGEKVEILGNLPDGNAIALLQDNMLVTSFHPELTSDTRFHQFFLSMIKSSNIAER